jgi:hypothetical protein
MAEIMPTSRSIAADIARSYPDWLPPTGPDSVPFAAIGPGRTRSGQAQRRAAWQAWSVSLVCGVVLLGCCHSPPVTKEIDASASAIRFEHGDFRPELSEYVVQEDPCTHGQAHLASFHGSDSVGMLVVVQAGAGRVRREQSLESSVQELMPEGAASSGARAAAPDRARATHHIACFRSPINR